MTRKLICLATICLLSGPAGAQELGEGKVLFEYWFGGGINSDLATLRADPNFPDNPAMSEWRDGMDRPDLVDQDYWGGRGRAFLTPSQTGDYTFWIASDDASELWLSTDDDPANAARIASVEGWTDYRNWTGPAGAPGPNRQSAPIALTAGQRYYLETLFSDGTGGGHVSVAWAGPGVGETPTLLAGEVLTAFIRDPEPLMQAQSPNPANEATDVSDRPTLTWTPGVGAEQHDVFLSADPNAVAAGDPNALQGRVAEATFRPEEPLTWNTTYYWRVDEIDPNGAIAEGLVWSFTVANFLVISEEEIAVAYDNTRAPFLTEAAVEVAPDWTANDVNELVLRFMGGRAPVGSFTFDDVNQVYTVFGPGADIWGTADQFEYVYTLLNGDGIIRARVDGIQVTDPWAKAGVMIRESLEPGSKHALMAVTASNGVAFQNRVETDQGSFNSNTPGLAAPYWVRLVREGNLFTAYRSTDGENWELQPGSAETPNPREIVMDPNVLMGLAVTSHVNAETTTEAVFSEVCISGGLVCFLPLRFGHDLGTNDPQPIYVRIEDANGVDAAVTYPDPAATQITDWRTWRIPLSEFADVNLASVANLYLGVGDVNNPQSDGSGVVLFDNLRAAPPVVITEPNDVTSPDDNVFGVPDDNDWPAAEGPGNVADNDANTKYLHFKGATEPTGFQIELAAASIVTGLTLTTANDAPERDPVQYEVYGATEGIAGPYTLIAGGDIPDFAGETEWPRFTENATPITFDNSTPYKYYQVLFPTLRDPATANSMQIAEVELIGTTAP